MKKLNLTLAAIFFIAALISCNKSDTGTNPSPEGITQSDTKGGNIAKATAANPAIVYSAAYTSGGITYPSALWVMDADGTHKTMIYHPNSGTVGAGQAHWSSDGSSICFNQSSCLYKLDFSLVNGVPTASNVTKIVDSATNHSSIFSGYWSFGSVNEILYMEQQFRSSLYRSIKAISTNGTISTVYTPPSGWYLASCITGSPDGSKVAFSLNDHNGNNYLKVINRSDASEAYSIKTDGTGSIMPSGVVGGVWEMEWSRTSTKIAVAAQHDNTDGSATTLIYTIDVTNPSSLTLVGSKLNSFTWSPDDSKLIYFNNQYPSTYKSSINTINLSNGTVTVLCSNITAGGLNWKK